ncbi:TRAP transporter small permease [Rhizobiales bacterium]|uniref:TRAP transporter small permease n=1 Tax=Hongsoonwoonella zoysiae TaxID=2821844 RepID=UPI0015602F89|nr:TRAP transporter small permease [Hongsoonwoonella zoysiae]NRG17818.1 TRAP transporter small permease [Hongsoonwoonella zoysiae]
MRPILTRVYALAEMMAASCLVIIAALVLLQVMGRIADGTLKFLGFEAVGFLVPSLAEIAGFLLVGASFLALASTLRHAVHIRVSLAISHAPAGLRKVMETLVLVLGLALIGYFSWYAVLLSLDSYQFNELSFGIIPIPLWIPQAVMALGLIVFAVSILDDLIVQLSGGTPSYVLAEQGKGIEGAD